MTELQNLKTDIIEITPKALEQINKIFLSENKSLDSGLRVGVIGGGCSGLSYKIDFGQKKEKDNVYHANGVQIFIDPKSSIYLKGVRLDFQDGLNGKGFVFENPSAKNVCGCGESFSI